MIASLNGIVEEKGVDQVVVDVNGVGYRVCVSVSSMTRVPPVGQRVKLRVRTVVREDAFDLYGFTTPAEEALFGLLTSVPHVGPKVAISVLSGMEAPDVARCIAAGDMNRLTKIHGVGKKTAERLVVELKDKVGALVSTAEHPVPVTARSTDLVAALLSLGYKPAQAERVAAEAEEKLGADAALDALIREALRAARG